MKYAVVTFGCRVNQADSMAVEEALRARGACDAPVEDADIVVVNTCTVTASADQGARQVIRRIARDNPTVQLVVTGCYATRRPDEVAALPNVGGVVPNLRKDDLVRDLDLPEWTAWTAGREEQARVLTLTGGTTADRDGDGPCGSALQPGVAGRTALTLRVQTGCDEPCSYCVIPRTRGAGRSRPLAGVLGDVQRAVAVGYKEIVITGVHLGSYGRDLGGGATLERLVGALADWPDDVLFRISSLEPMDCSAALIDTVAASPRVAPHFHLPLQHGSDDILAAMRRPYTAAFYRGVVDTIHARMPHASIGTDVIVGFPGEREEHAEATLALISTLPLSHVHVFPYSDRPGTVAATLGDRASGVDVRARAAAVREVSAQLSQAFQARQIGTRRRALTLDGGTRAVTDNFLKLSLPPGRSRNAWVDVQIGGVPGALEGIPVSG